MAAPPATWQAGEKDTPGNDFFRAGVPPTSERPLLWCHGPPRILTTADL
eukprot:CAMPEP_0179202204 /NCGR_PEP_ID=MMETSP0796-20121207/100701_1 /TAXON_ID=73915 /ORGANISM="Pyrodinium bahamense, Strain pbaha01" /LENGTH=48 /DNA_ID= /DNA_START= /DNA_END= /DNA_ORIENTATION=